MKKKTIISCFAIVATFLSFTFPMKLYALNYTISFTGTGASTSVQSVVVQNLTKGTTVTVPTGNVLILSDVATSIEKVTEMTNGISIYPNPLQEKSAVTFYAKQAGSTQISIFSLDGRKIIGTNDVFLQGKNSFQVSVPNGVYLLQIQGNEFSYSTKLISKLNSEIKSQITFISNDNQLAIKPQKSKSAETTMLYSSGDRLLYKGISGNYCTIVTDKPTESKTTNFEFVECKDGDGNYYTTVQIGTQIWMAENLKTTKFNDGSNIQLTTDATVWANLSTPSYCWYNNSISFKDTYGALYNWFTVDTGRLAPAGWHVPTDTEWTILSDYLGGASVAGGKLKESGNSHWPSPNTGATNETGFSATPSGMRNTGGVDSSTDSGYWWSSSYNGTIYSSYAWAIAMYSDSRNVSRQNYITKTYGYSVRCIKD